METYEDVKNRMSKFNSWETEETIKIIKILEKEMDNLLAPIRDKFDELSHEISSTQNILKYCIALDNNANNKNIKSKRHLKVQPCHVSFGDWECKDSPTKKCIYGYEDDYAHDHCLYCGKPEERK